MTTPASSKPRGLFVLSPWAFEQIYSQDGRQQLGRRLDFTAPPQTPESVKANPAVLRPVEVLVTGWGGPRLDEAMLDAMPDLRLVLYGAGSIKPVVTDAFWARRIPIVSAFAANAVPVAEYTLGTILLSLKRFWSHAIETRRMGSYGAHLEVPGVYGSTVGLVSLGMVGRRVAALLGSFDVKVVAFDPYVSAEDAKGLGAQMVTLEEVFRRSDVVSVHTPLLPATEGMIRGAHFDAMKQHATFINTARGAVVREDEMIGVLERRPDLTAVLDVTHPEPPVPGSALYVLTNVILTPHIAGSMDNECRRMGRYVIEELDRFLRGEPLRWQISRERAQISG